MSSGPIAGNSFFRTAVNGPFFESNQSPVVEDKGPVPDILKALLLDIGLALRFKLMPQKIEPAPNLSFSNNLNPR